MLFRSFVAVEMRVESEGRDRVLGFRTNVGDAVVVDRDHPLRFVADPGTDGLKPYVLVRGRLEARLSRPVLYDLVEIGETAEIDGRAWFGVWSSGAFFPMSPADAIGATP